MINPTDPASRRAESKKKYYYAHREEMLEYSRKWRVAHPERQEIYNAKRREKAAAKKRAEIAAKQPTEHQEGFKHVKFR